jgi:hypothetical protein
LIPSVEDRPDTTYKVAVVTVPSGSGMGAAAACRLRADGQSVAILQGGTCYFLGENYIKLTPNLIHRFKCP